MGFKVVFVMIFCMSSRIVCDSNCDVLKSSVKCFSPNWEYLECTVPVIKNCVIMEMKESHNVMVPIQSSSDVQIFRTSSHLESSDLQNFFTLANICEETLTLSIKSSCCDSATIDINIVKIVEPGDMNLKEILSTSTSIEAHIERHQNLYCLFFKIPLNYKVQLRSQRKSIIMEFNFINLAENIDIIKVDNLVPDTKYEVFAKSQPTEAQNSSLWSPTLQFSVQTKPDVPPVAQISASGFSLTGLNRSVSLLSLHWAAVPSHLHYGPNFRYRVTVMQEKQQNENKLFETIFETEMAEANFLVPRNENITATITSVNQVGEASTASTISIPFLSSGDKVSLMDAIVVDKNNTYSVYWKHEGDKEGTITIFWCYSHIRNGVQWRRTDINKGGFSIPSEEGSAVLPVHLALTYRDNNNNNNNYLVSTGMQRVTCILIPEHRRLHPVLKLQPSLSESNQLVFLYHFSICPFTNPSPYVRSYVLTYLKENTTKDASTVVGREPEIVVPHLTPGSCYLFKSLEVTTLDGHLLKTDYNKIHCTVAPPKLISAIVSESDPYKLLITLEPTTILSFSGNSSCKLDIDGREHIVDCSATVVLSHSIHPNNPCPSIRTSLCSPSKWPPRHCSPWSPFYPIVKAPPTPILNKLSIRPNSMLEVEYVTGPADTCEVRRAHNLSTRIFPIKSHAGPSCNNYGNSINIINNISSVLIPMDLCQQYNISVRCGNVVKTRVEDSRSVRMSGWSSAQTSELSCTEPLTPIGTLAGTAVGLIIVTIIISILFIRTYRYVQNLRRRFGFPDELGDIPLANMNHEQKAPMFGEPFGRINNNIPRPYHSDMNHEQTPFIPQPYDGVISLSRTCQKLEKEQANEVSISETMIYCS